MSQVQQDRAQDVPNDEDEAVSEGFLVNSDDAANWVVRKIVEARAYSQRCAEWCAKEQARAKRAEDFFLWRFGAQLRSWLEQELGRRGGRLRSVRLPAGTVGIRRVPASLIVEDEGSVLAWAREHHRELVVVSERISKSALKAYVTDTGDVPACGVRVEPARDSFYVT